MIRFFSIKHFPSVPLVSCIYVTAETLDQDEKLRHSLPHEVADLQWESRRYAELAWLAVIGGGRRYPPRRYEQERRPEYVELQSLLCSHLKPADARRNWNELRVTPVRFGHGSTATDSRVLY